MDVCPKKVTTDENSNGKEVVAAFSDYCNLCYGNLWRDIRLLFLSLCAHCPGLVERTHLDVNGNQAEAEQEADPAYPSSLLERRLQEEFGGHRRMAWKSRKAVSFS